MNMKLRFQPVVLSMLFSSMVLVAGCSQSNDANSDSKNKDLSRDVKKELKTAQIKTFPKTADDRHDIDLLIEYDQKFNEMNSALEADLKKMLDEGNLTPELELQRKQDSVRSAQNMLKDLDLKTEQGRYIQGLLYQYWEKQAKKYKNGQSSMNQKDHPNNKVKGMGDLITANNQLEYWKSQNSYTETDEMSNTEVDGEASSDVETAH